MIYSFFIYLMNHILRRMINAVGACVAAADAVSMAVLAAAALAWKGTENAERADIAVMVIQLIVFAGATRFH